jgi:hypothetical protein
VHLAWALWEVVVFPYEVTAKSLSTLTSPEEVRYTKDPPFLPILKVINYLGCFQNLLFKSSTYASLGSIFFASSKLKLVDLFIAINRIEFGYKTSYAHAT